MHSLKHAKLATAGNIVIIRYAMNYFCNVFFLAVFSIFAVAPVTPFAATRKTTSQKKAPAKKQVTRYKEYQKSAAVQGGSRKVQTARVERPLQVYMSQDGRVLSNQVPRFGQTLKGKPSKMTSRNEVIFYSMDPALQNLAEKLVANAHAPHVAIVAMQPRTGQILAIAQKSVIFDDLALHAGFPAASLFKVVTAAASIERARIEPTDEVSFRGGIYALGLANYRPNARQDKLSMSVGEALGRSCNPVFGRLALEYLSPRTLLAYANAFGFNASLPFDLPLPQSTATIPETDYELSRTGAGFGAVTVSPVHAAAIMSAIANGGVMPRPWLLERVVSAQGQLLVDSRPAALGRVIRSDTAVTLMEMMENTTTIGTSKREFLLSKSSRMKNTRVAAKTGTLRGENPLGLNHWFIASAPVENPKIAIAIIAVDGGALDSKPSHLGRLILEKYLLG